MTCVYFWLELHTEYRVWNMCCTLKSGLFLVVLNLRFTMKRAIFCFEDDINQI